MSVVGKHTPTTRSLIELAQDAEKIGNGIADLAPSIPFMSDAQQASLSAYRLRDELVVLARRCFDTPSVTVTLGDKAIGTFPE